MTKWTPKEDEILKDGKAQGFSMEKIAKLLPGRSRCACQSRIDRLAEAGGANVAYGSKSIRRAFTDDESLDLLAMYEYERLPFSKIARKLHRSSIDVEAHYRSIMADLAKSEAA